MSLHIDALADLVRQSVDDSDATREDWLRAVDQVFPREQEPELDPFVPIAGEPPIFWEVNCDEDVSPAEAAKRVWQRLFRRGTSQPAADKACVFTVVVDGREVEIDLSEERYAHLFDD